MKTCPQCGQENADEAAACYFCGNRLTPPVPSAPPPGSSAPPPGSSAPPPPTGVEPTQQMHPRPAGQGPRPRGPEDQGGPPADAGKTAPRRVQPLGGQTQARPAQPAQPQPAPPYRGAPAYPQQMPPPPASIPPPPPAGPRRMAAGDGRFWGILALVLGGVLLCICALASWTLLNASAGGLTRLRSGISTQAAGLFPGGDAPLPTPSPAPALADTPTPWPTFTAPPGSPAPPPGSPAPPPENTQPVPEPTGAGEPTNTQASPAEKLLSPECKTALETLGSMGDELSANPLAILDETWRAAFEQARQNLTDQCGSLDAASPVPGRLADVQRSLALANESLDQAGRLWQEFLDAPDPAKLIEAGKQVQQATGHINDALKALRELGQ